jgi:HEAT repeat protein
MRPFLLILGVVLVATGTAQAQVKLLDVLICHLEDDPSAAAEVRKAGRDAVPALLEAFERYRSCPVRNRVTELLGEIAPDDPRVRRTLLEALEDRDEDTTVRAGAAGALTKLLGKDKTVGEAVLKALLQDQDWEVRGEVAFELRISKQKPRVALPALLKALQDPDQDVRGEAALALAGMGEPDRVVPAILASLRDIETCETHVHFFISGVDIDRWKYLSIALGQIGLPAVPHLRQALTKPERLVRAGAALAYGEMDQNVPGVKKVLKEAAPAIAGLLQDKEVIVRECACDSLKQMGKAAASAVPALIQSLKDEDLGVRCHASWALGSIGPAAASAVPELIKAMEDKGRGASRYAAASALGGIGPAAKAAVPALTQARSEDAEMDRTAGWSLQAILNPPRPPTALEQIECWLKVKLGISVNLSGASRR